MKLLYLMMKKLQKHSLNIFVTWLKPYHYQKVLLLRSRRLNSLPTLLHKTLNEINKLNHKKASQATDIPVKIIKENKDVISFYVFHNFNIALSSCCFSTALKYADVRPAFKKDDKTDKENDRPISILPNLSKVYERLMYNQMYPFLIKSFQNYNAVFVKVFAQSSV